MSDIARPGNGTSPTIMECAPSSPVSPTGGEEPGFMDSFSGPAIGLDPHEHLDRQQASVQEELQTALNKYTDARPKRFANWKKNQKKKK